MLKNIIDKVKNLYLLNFKDTTKEPEDDIPELLSNVFVRVKLPFSTKLKFLFKKEVFYRLKSSEVDFIKSYKGR